MLTHQQILDFYGTVHENIQNLDTSSEFKEVYSEYRYRVLNDGNEYSVIIPSQSFATNTSFAILKEFNDGKTELELNEGEDGLSFLDGELFINKPEFFADILSTRQSFDITAEPYEAESFEVQQKEKEKKALERLRHVKPDEHTAHFMAIFEYRLPDDSVYYVAFNKRGLTLARQQDSFLPYPFYNRVGDLSKVYFVDLERVQYDRSFRDQRNYL